MYLCFSLDVKDPCYEVNLVRLSAYLLLDLSIETFCCGGSTPYTEYSLLLTLRKVSIKLPVRVFVHAVTSVVSWKEVRRRRAARVTIGHLSPFPSIDLRYANVTYEALD